MCINLVNIKPILIRYLGGERSIKKGEYRRRIRIGRVELDDMPDFVIDLMEVYHVIKEKTDTSQPSFCRAVHSLIKKKYIKPVTREGFSRKRIRFAVLNDMKEHNT